MYYLTFLWFLSILLNKWSYRNCTLFSEYKKCDQLNISASGQKLQSQVELIVCCHEVGENLVYTVYKYFIYDFVNKSRSRLYIWYVLEMTEIHQCQCLWAASSMCWASSRIDYVDIEASRYSTINGTEENLYNETHSLRHSLALEL